MYEKRRDYPPDLEMPILNHPQSSFTIINHHEPMVTHPQQDRDVRGGVGAQGHRRRHFAGHRGGGRWKQSTLESGAGTFLIFGGEIMVIFPWW